MAKLTIKDLALQYARQLGHDDYPAVDQCPYSSAKSPALYAQYWSGWEDAAAEIWRDHEVARGVRAKSQSPNNRTNATLARRKSA